MAPWCFLGIIIVALTKCVAKGLLKGSLYLFMEVCDEGFGH